jgi:hypothetical protein
VFEPKYEEQFTAFVDFLGFGERIAELGEETRAKVLTLLQSVAGLAAPPPASLAAPAARAGGSEVLCTPGSLAKSIGCSSQIIAAAAQP